MRVNPDGGPTLPNATPSETRSFPPGSTPVPLVRDRVDAVAAWARDEWTTLAGAAHGLASAPGVVSKAWSDAASTNERLAKSITATLDHWQGDWASTREVAIDGLQKAARPVSTAASRVAGELAQANRLPLAVETSVDAAIAELPAGARASLREMAHAASASLNVLAPPVESRARAAAHSLEIAASAQRTKAATTVATLSEHIGKTVGKVHGSLSGKPDAITLLDRVPFLRDTPMATVLLTGAGIVNDVHAGKSLADASVANVGGTVLGTVAGSALTEGVSSWIEGAAIADGTAAALGAAAATGPVGWTVAAGVIAGAAVGYGVYKVVESKAGQDVIDGVARLDTPRFERGVEEARSAIVSSTQSAGQWISSRLPAVHA